MLPKHFTPLLEGTVKNEEKLFLYKVSKVTRTLTSKTRMLV